MNSKNERIKVYDMTCTSCEKTVERAIMKLDGVKRVKASFSGQYADVEYDPDVCSIEKIKEAVVRAGYSVQKKKNYYSIAGIVVIGIIIILLGKSTQGFDMEKMLGSASYLVLFAVGILTSIHCVGMCGGIMLSQSINSDNKGKFKAIKPALLYNAGRVISYTILGGIVGGIGSAFSMSIGLKSALQIIAGIFMVIMGLNMAGFSLFRKIHIRLPWSSCSSGKKAKTPFVVGLLNGLMPCGPLQTMQLYALGTESIFKGALSMLLFSIGTVPLMLTFGALSGILSKGYTKNILKFSGVLIIVLGLIMGSRGLALSGINVSSLIPLNRVTANAESVPQAAKPEIKDGVQVIKMTADNRGYTPNLLYVQKGIPVRWEIDGKQINSCNNAIVIPSLNKEQKLKNGENVIEFTPGDKDISFSCWMGMINGVIKVVDNLDNVDPSKDAADLPPSGSPSCCTGGAPVQQDSIYGDDISKVATDRLIKKAVVKGSGQVVTFKGTGYEFDPLIIAANKGTKTTINIDLTNYDNPDGKYILIAANSDNPLKTFDGKKGVVTFEYTFAESNGYAIIKDNTILGIIEVVDDIKAADLENIRQKYIN